MQKSVTENYRWRIVILLFFATTINYIDRQVIGILKPYIAGDLGWSESSYGYIVTTFQVAYALGLLTTGRFLDKYGTRLGYTIAMVVWSIAGIFHAAARSTFAFSAARFFLGVGESANFPAAVKTVAEWFPKKERALATGWFNLGSGVGTFLTPILVSGTFVLLGWQCAFIITGSLGFIWIIFWLKFFHTPQGHPKLSAKEYSYILSDAEEKDDVKRMEWVNLFKHWQTFAICLSRFLTDWVWWFILFWIPDFLNKVYNVNIKEVVIPLIIIYSGSSLGGIAGGWLSSQLIKRGRSIDFSRKITILVCALGVLPMLLIPQVNSLWISVGIISLATACHSGFASNIFTVVSDIYPKQAVGSMVGVSGFAGAVGGALSASFIGLLLDATGSYFLVFLCAGSAYMIVWAVLKVFIPNIEPIKI